MSARLPLGDSRSGKTNIVSIDTSTGTPIRVGGAALLSGPALVIRPNRQDDVVRGVADAGFAGLGARRPLAPDQLRPATPPPAAQFSAPQRELLQATWGVPTYFDGAPFGPPYELPERTAEWELSITTRRQFQGQDRTAKMASKVHPRGPELQTAGTFLSSLYGVTPTPDYLGLGLDALM